MEAEQAQTKTPSSGGKNRARMSSVKTGERIASRAGENGGSPQYTLKKTVRILFVGPSRSGKTSLVQRIVHDRFLSDEAYSPTFEDHYFKEVEIEPPVSPRSAPSLLISSKDGTIIPRAKVSLEILDVGPFLDDSGFSLVGNAYDQSDPTESRRVYVRTSDAFLLVLDATDRDAMDKCEAHAAEIKKFSRATSAYLWDQNLFPMIIVVSKVEDVTRVPIDIELIEGLCHRIGAAGYSLTSAAAGLGTERVLQRAVHAFWKADEILSQHRWLAASRPASNRGSRLGVHQTPRASPVHSPSSTPKCGTSTERSNADDGASLRRSWRRSIKEHLRNAIQASTASGSRTVFKTESDDSIHPAHLDADESTNETRGGSESRKSRVIESPCGSVLLPYLTLGMDGEERPAQRIGRFPSSGVDASSAKPHHSDEPFCDTSSRITSDRTAELSALTLNSPGSDSQLAPSICNSPSSDANASNDSHRPSAPAWDRERLSAGPIFENCVRPRGETTDGFSTPQRQRRESKLRSESVVYAAIPPPSLPDGSSPILSRFEASPRAESARPNLRSRSPSINRETKSRRASRSNRVQKGQDETADANPKNDAPSKLGDRASKGGCCVVM